MNELLEDVSRYRWINVSVIQDIARKVRPCGQNGAQYLDLELSIFNQDLRLEKGS
jgi:hypothetical protein